MDKDKQEFLNLLKYWCSWTCAFPHEDDALCTCQKPKEDIWEWIESKKAEWQGKAVHDHELKIRVQENKFAIERIKEMTRQKIRELQGRQRLLEKDLRSISKGGDSER